MTALSNIQEDHNKSVWQAVENAQHQFQSEPAYKIPSFQLTIKPSISYSRSLGLDVTSTRKYNFQSELGRNEDISTSH